MNTGNKGPIERHPVLSHPVTVLSVYELGPGSTPVPRYDGPTSRQTDPTR